MSGKIEVFLTDLTNLDGFFYSMTDRGKEIFLGSDLHVSKVCKFLRTCWRTAAFYVTFFTAVYRKIQSFI